MRGGRPGYWRRLAAAALALAAGWAALAAAWRVPAARAVLEFTFQVGRRS